MMLSATCKAYEYRVVGLILEWRWTDISTRSRSDRSISYKSLKDNVAKISKNIYSIDGSEILFPGHTVIP
ncbi:MAG TPA: hypothetical protein VEH06_11055 [Candidatus Bathyarchaeia archaeon]|nr:hypothetical protein [Candidatus Bathyarchaeia archaeon]